MLSEKTPTDIMVKLEIPITMDKALPMYISFAKRECFFIRHPDSRVIVEALAMRLYYSVYNKKYSFTTTWFRVGKDDQDKRCAPHI
jgi:hypothetical protein